jgi:hypothetical protein
MNAREKVETLLMALGLAYDEPSWHGPNLRGSLRGVDPEAASWRPDPERHNIWEIVVHAAYWKYAARRRLAQEKRGAFPLSGSNWFERPEERSLVAWRSDVEILEDQHRKLTAVVEQFTDEDLTTQVGKNLQVQQLVQGVAFHDIYHAGQIRLLRRFQSGRPHE